MALGDNVVLDHAYIWSNVHIASNVVISQSVVCDKVEVKEGVKLNKQCVLAYNVSDIMHSLTVLVLFSFPFTKQYHTFLNSKNSIFYRSEL